MVGAVDSHAALKRGIVRGIKHVVRDRRWGTTLLLLTLLLFLMQLLTVFLLCGEGANRFLVSRAALHVEILPTAAQENIQALYAALREQPYVRDIAFVTKEQALEQEKRRDPDLVRFLQEYKIDNPYPDTLSVTLSTLDSYDAFNGFIQNERWKNVVNPSYLSSATDQEQSIRILLQVTQVVRILVAFFIGVGFFILCFAIIEWVLSHMARRRNELLLEHVLGAQPLSMLAPLVTQMSVFLLIAHVIAMAAIVLLLVLLPLLMPAVALEEPFVELKEQMTPLLWSVLPSLFVAQFFLLPLLALGGTLFGARSLPGARLAAD